LNKHISIQTQKVLKGSDILVFLFSTFNSIKESFNGKVLSWSPSISLEGVVFMITSWESSIFIFNFQDNIFDEVNELKGIFKDAWEDICNDFTQCRQEFAYPTSDTNVAV
jgi:hypothetical protein